MPCRHGGVVVLIRDAAVAGIKLEADDGVIVPGLRRDANPPGDDWRTERVRYHRVEVAVALQHRLLVASPGIAIDTVVHAVAGDPLADVVKSVARVSSRLIGSQADLEVRPLTTHRTAGSAAFVLGAADEAVLAPMLVENAAQALEIHAVTHGYAPGGAVGLVNLEGRAPLVLCDGVRRRAARVAGAVGQVVKRRHVPHHDVARPQLRTVGVVP